MVPKQARLNILDLLFAIGRSSFTIRLCKNDPAPDDEDIELADLTECDFDGYAAQTPVWGASTLDVDDVAYAETGVLEFTAGAGIAAPQTIYGVYATKIDTVGGGLPLLVWFHRLTSTVTLVNPGEKFRRICTTRDTNYAP